MDPRELLERWNYARGFSGLVITTDEDSQIEEKDVKEFGSQAEGRSVFINFILPDGNYILTSLFPDNNENMQKQLEQQMQVVRTQVGKGVITLSMWMFRPTWKVYKALVALRENEKILNGMMPRVVEDESE